MNGLLLPFILFFMLVLVNKKSLMGRYTNGPVYNTIAWTTAGLVTVLTVLMVGTSILERFFL
jgi:Mn2+/Fe2+ NRAMP family transporter